MGEKIDSQPEPKEERRAIAPIGDRFKKTGEIKEVEPSLLDQFLGKASETAFDIGDRLNDVLFGEDADLKLRSATGSHVILDVTDKGETTTHVFTAPFHSVVLPLWAINKIAAQEKPESNWDVVDRLIDSTGAIDVDRLMDSTGADELLPPPEDE